MSLFSINRFHRVRSWAPGVGGLAAQDVVSPPYILERPHVRNGFQAKLMPVGPEWWQDRRGRHHQTRHVQHARALLRAAHEGAIIFPALLPRPIRAALVMACGVAPIWLGDPGVTLAGMNAFLSSKLTPPFLGAVASGTTDTTQAIAVAMNFGVAGQAFAMGFAAPAKTVESLYAYVTAETGTSSMALRLRTRASGLPVDPAVQAATGIAAAATGWNEFGGLSTLLTYGTQYYLSLEDGTATDNITAQIGNNRLALPDLTVISRGLFWRSITTAGWTTQTAAAACTGVATFSDGTALGNPIATSATQSETQKGLYWIGGPTEDLDVYGFCWSDGSTAAQFTAGQIWSGTNGPGGSPDIDSSALSLISGDSTTGIQACLVSTDTPKRLTGGTDYRVIFSDNTAQTVGPRKYSIGAVQSGTVADLKLCLPYAGNWQWTDETSNAWANDSEGFPGLALLIADQVAISGGSGGMPPFSRSAF